MEGDNRNLGVYYNKVAAHGPDNDSIEIQLGSQGLNVTPNLRLQNTRMVYQVPSTGTTNQYVEVTFNSPINWEDCTLHTLLLDNSAGTIQVLFTFSQDYNFLDQNPLQLRQILVPAGQRVKFYMSIISGKIYAKTTLNSDPVTFIPPGGLAAALATILTGP